MGNSKGRLAKLFSIPVMAIAGFLVAASIAGVGGATGTTVALEGCTPGYWKVEQHWDSWPVPTTTTFADVGINAGSTTLLAAMSFSGGPTLQDAKNLLLHHAAAAYLNAASGDVDYKYTTAEVVSMANAALASSSRSYVLGVKNQFDSANNAGCPLN